MTLPLGFEPHYRFDFFEPGDRTALVCLDVPEMQRLVIEQLDVLGYRVHTGLFLDDCILKLQAHCYDAVIVSDFFNGSKPENHRILAEASHAPAAQRRRQVYILIGPDYSTNDELEAFARSVDVVVALADVENMKPILRRAIQRQAEFYQSLHDVIERLARECDPLPASRG